jgi:hypothetical protein
VGVQFFTERAAAGHLPSQPFRVRRRRFHRFAIFGVCRVEESLLVVFEQVLLFGFRV